MDITDSVKIIYGRINKYNIDLGSSAKIIGYLLLFHTPEELTEYALSSDKQFYAVIREVNDKFNSMIKHNAASHMPSDHSPRYVSPPPTISGLVTSPSSFRVPAWQPHPTSNEFLGNLRIQPDLPVCSSNYHYSDARLGGGLGSRCSMRSPSGIPSGMIDCSTKPCHYFNGGFCRNGVSCRFSHDKGIPDGISLVYNPSQDDLVNEDHDFSPGLLKKLSVEISEILKENNGGPISMATLLMLYFVRYGKTLQAEDYLTESQRHGKAGCSLTKLLALLKTIQLIVGPHGQHSVVLAEDAPRYMEQYNEKTDAGALLACAHQIYLTFPAESTFTDDDVFNYFKQFGPVQDVRIPRQEKRMFGFVSFQYAETVKTIFETMRPHIICGSRVLVKPYKEKAGIYDRKYSEKVEPPLHYPSHCFHPDINTDINTVPTIYENSGVLNNQLWEDQERAFEVERARFMGMHLSPELPTLQHLEHLKFSDGLSNSVLVSGNNDSTDEKPKPTGNDCSDQESDSIELPESPFASN